MQRSAEWLRGAVESHINTCNLITSITSATKSHPARQGLIAAGNELHNQLDRYRALLAEAEAREASAPTAEDEALPLPELQLKHAELAVELFNADARLEKAAEVIEACRVALEEIRAAVTTSTGQCGVLGTNWAECDYCGAVSTARKEPIPHEKGCAFAVSTAALALCARWKEANGGK